MVAWQCDVSGALHADGTEDSRSPEQSQTSTQIGPSAHGLLSTWCATTTTIESPAGQITMCALTNEVLTEGTPAFAGTGRLQAQTSAAVRRKCFIARSPPCSSPRRRP